MRGVLQAETITVAEPSIHFEAGGEILAAERARPRRCLQGQRPADAPRIAELPRRVGDVFRRENVLRDVPASKIARENQLQLELAVAFRARQRIPLGLSG